MSTLDLRLSKQQHPAAFSNQHSTHRLQLILGSVILLVAVDQMSKAFALWWAPSAAVAMADPAASFGIGWHIHAPNPHSFEIAMIAFGVVGVLWLLPVSDAAKVLWTAAALSNHVEMLLRPGTVDFLSFGNESRVWVANIADVYFVASFAFIAVSVWKMTQHKEISSSIIISAGPNR
ncbi:MAG TPA: hypothetical protein VEK08_03110 [Planctomycetota bacterium]|nr:hypothetical protein [Planctomycetota bacterium]